MSEEERDEGSDIEFEMDWDDFTDAVKWIRNRLTDVSPGGLPITVEVLLSRLEEQLP